MSRPLRKILIVHTAGGIGDVLLSTAVVAALARVHPQARIDFLAQQRTHSALLGHPQIGRLYTWPGRGPGGLAAWWRWAAQLRRERYDAAVVLWSTTATAWLTVAAGIPRRIGQDSRLSYSFLYTDRIRVRSEHGDEDSHWCEILLDYVRPLVGEPGHPEVFLHIPQEAQERARALLAELPGQGPLIGFHPFKGPPVPLERWPLPVFAGWIREIHQQLGARLVVTGSPGEAPFAEEILRLADVPGAKSVAGQTDLVTLAALSRECDAFVCPDSGPMHVAAVAGARVLGVYALEEDFPRRWAPVSSTARILRPQPTGCPPQCRKPTCSDFRCYRQIRPQQLVEELRELLRVAPPSQS